MLFKLYTVSIVWHVIYTVHPLLTRWFCLCFVVQDRLIGAMEPLLGSLSPSEKARNSHGPHLLFVYSADSLGPLSFADPEKYPTIVNNYAK